MSRKIASLALSTFLMLISAVTAFAQKVDQLERRGEAVLKENCSRCHAIGRAGRSTHPSAPPFRTLGQRYEIEALAEALAEGLSTGHPDMPEFVFEVDDVSAILAYLQSIQEPKKNNIRTR